MPQKGEDKQVPPDQRSRGLNHEHPEGQANERNQKTQTGASEPRPPAKQAGG